MGMESNCLGFMESNMNTHHASKRHKLIDVNVNFLPLNLI